MWQLLMNSGILIIRGPFEGSVFIVVGPFDNKFFATPYMTGPTKFDLSLLKGTQGLEEMAKISREPGKGETITKA